MSLTAEKIPTLDGIRALSVVLVVASHAGFGGVVPGGFGVTVFFFLSGFLITGLLRREFEQTSRINVIFFFIRRFIRLMPAFFISITTAYLLVFFGVIDGSATAVGFAAQVFYFANYFTIFYQTDLFIPAGTGVYWSLAVEEHFYFVYPLLFSSLIVKKEESKKLLLFLILVVLLLPIWRYYLYVIEARESSRVLYATDTRIDSIAFGCILALLKNPMRNIGERKFSFKGYLLACSALLILLGSFLVRDEVFRMTLRYTVQGAALCPLFYYGVAFYNSPVFSVLNYRPLMKIGGYSYSIYLFHDIVIAAIEKNFQSFATSHFFFPVVLISSIFLAALVYHFVEKPIKFYRAKYR